MNDSIDSYSFLFLSKKEVYFMYNICNRVGILDLIRKVHHNHSWNHLQDEPKVKWSNI